MDFSTLDLDLEQDVKGLDFEALGKLEVREIIRLREVALQEELKTLTIENEANDLKNHRDHVSHNFYRTF